MRVEGLSHSFCDVIRVQGTATTGMMMNVAETSGSAFGGNLLSISTDVATASGSGYNMLTLSPTGGSKFSVRPGSCLLCNSFALPYMRIRL